MDNENQEKLQDQKVGMVSASNFDKRIPKFCNGIMFNKLSDGGLILTLVYREAIQMGENPQVVDESMIIEKVIIDKEHAKKIAETLNELTK